MNVDSLTWTIWVKMMGEVDAFWITILWALLSTFIHTIGFTALAEKLLLVYAAIFQRKAYREYMEASRQLWNARKELRSTSAQDQFAKWARQQRRVDQLQNEFDKLNGQRQLAIITKKFAVSMILRCITYAFGMWWLVYRNSGISLLNIPKDVFGPFAYFLAIPRLPTGSLSASMLFMLSNAAFARIASQWQRSSE